MAREDDEPVTHTAESASRYETFGRTTATDEGIKQTAIRASIWVAIAVGGLLVLGGIAVGIYFLVVHLKAPNPCPANRLHFEGRCLTKHCTDDQLKGYVYSARCDNGDAKLSKWIKYVYAKVKDLSNPALLDWIEFADVLRTMHAQRKNPACGDDDRACLKKDFDFLQNSSWCGLSRLSYCIGEAKLEKIIALKYLSTCTSGFDSCLNIMSRSISDGDFIRAIRQAKIVAHVVHHFLSYSLAGELISTLKNMELEDAVSYIYLFLSHQPWFQQMAAKLNIILKQLFVDKKIVHDVTVNIPPNITLLLGKLHNDTEVSHTRFWYRSTAIYIPLSDEDLKLPQFPKAVTHQSRLSDAEAQYVVLPLSVIQHCIDPSSEICNDFLLSSVIADILKQTVRNKNCDPVSLLQVKCEIHIYNVISGLPGITVGRYYWPSRLAFLNGVAKNLNGQNTYSVYDTACSDGSNQLKKDCALSDNI